MVDVPGPLAEFIVGEIRRARAASGQTQEAFGKLAGFSGSHVSAVENGTRTLTMDFVRGGDRALHTGGVYERLVLKFGAPSWFQPWLDAEQKADQIRTFQPNLIPGLLQTEDYARVVFQLDTELSEAEVEQAVASRIDRQAVLDRDDPPYLIAVLDEAALHRFAEGSDKMLAAQLLHLLRMAERPRVSVHVIPAGVGLHLGLSGPFVLARSPEGDWVGHMEDQLGGTVVHRTEQVARLLARWESVRNEALPTRQSLDLIKEVVKPWI
ncbi:helix-turn-helix transcriptional regulator [Micromonospora sp. NBC_01699]|uniref:helix-turn-helix domain-containing protein n=1 Tax=Micromonospora sp. NBC_01699 TaxID=2975984 RepID=UPI002E31B4BA|nr:helix-turn-helix transcriptional regulator [Micromonospora sp. NBC_01699]